MMEHAMHGSKQSAEELISRDIIGFGSRLLAFVILYFHKF